MINTVLQAIEKFESSERCEMIPDFDLSAELETSVVPTIALENFESDDASIHIDTEEDTSDDSDDSKDIKEVVASEQLAFHTNPVYIKQTLKDKIRFRRESEGAGEITDLFGPPIEYQLTEEEKLKNEQRKQRNRRSANKSRLKRIAYEKKLEQDASYLQNEHAKLSKEVEEMKKKKILYYHILKQHLQTTCKKVPEAVKQRICQWKQVSSVADSPNTLTVSMQTDTFCPRIGPMSKNQLATSQRDSHLPLNCPLSSSSRPGPKRSHTDEVSLQLAKVGTFWNQTQSTSYNSYSAQNVSQTFMSNGLQTNATTVFPSGSCDIAESVSAQTIHDTQDITSLCETSVDCTTIQTSFCGPCAPVYTSVGSISDNQTREEDATEQQKINKIKEHLLDGFEMASER